MTPLDLKVRRVRVGLTQYELARKCGLHPARLSEMEAGKRPIPDLVIEVLDQQLAGAVRGS